MDGSSSPPIYCEKTTSEDKTRGKLRMSKLIIGITVAVTIVVVTSIVAGIVYFCLATNAIKMYHNLANDGTSVVKQDIEIDTGKNTMIFHLGGDGIGQGSFAMLDYAKSLTGFYDAGNKKCYLIGGIQKDLITPEAFKDILEKNTSQTDSVNQTFDYELSLSYPVNDKSFLPSTLKSSCAHIPVFWLQPAQESTTDTGRQKRQACVVLRCRRCWFNIRGLAICEREVFRCCGVRLCQGVSLPDICRRWQEEKSN